MAESLSSLLLLSAPRKPVPVQPEAGTVISLPTLTLKMLKQAGERGSPHSDRQRTISGKVPTMLRVTSSILLGTFLLISGCSAPLKRDLTDCFHAEAGLGLGIYLEAQATDWLHPAIGVGDLALKPRQSIGWDPRPGQPVGQLRTAAFPVSTLALPASLIGNEDLFENWGLSSPDQILIANLSLSGNNYITGENCSLLRLHRLAPNPILTRAPSLEALTPRQQLSRDTWIGFSGTLLFFNFDFGINPLEIIDMMTSVLGWDLLADDERITEGPIGDPE